MTRNDEIRARSWDNQPTLRRMDAQRTNLAQFVADPAQGLRLLDKFDCERNLRGFVRSFWPVLEPGRAFIDGWALGAICEHLEAVSKGQIKRLLINVPPGFAKTSLTCVYWPCWEWGPKAMPHLRYISASYSERLTIRSNLWSRRLVQSERYRELWGDLVQVAEDEAGKERFSISGTGFRVATSVSGLGAGERGDRFIVDDPINTKESASEAMLDGAQQWFTEVVPTRINDPDKSAIVVIMQRVHERDVSGLILSKKLSYDHLCIPMEYERDHPFKSRTTLGWVDPRTEEGELAFPDRFSRRHLEEELKPQLRAWGGTYAEAGQLQQRPAPRGGGMFKRDWFRIVDRTAVPPGGRVVRGWDLAYTEGGGNYTVGAKLRKVGQFVYVEDVVREQFGPGKVENLLRGTALADGPQVIQSLPQDPGQAGKAQKGAYAALLSGLSATFSPETGSKEDRARPLAAQAEGGNLILVRGSWCDEFVNEACTFPRGSYNDQVDAASRAYAALLALPSSATTGEAPVAVEGE